MRARARLSSRRTSMPSISARPASGSSSVVRMRTAVVLPAPLGPRTPRICPRSTSKSTPHRASVSPNRLASPSATTAGTRSQPTRRGAAVLPKSPSVRRDSLTPFAATPSGGPMAAPLSSPPVVTLDEVARGEFLVRVYQHLLAAVVAFVAFEALLINLGAAEALYFAPFLHYFFEVEGDGTTTVLAAAVITGIGFAGLSAVALVTRADLSWLRPILLWTGVCALVLIAGALLFGLELGVWFSVAMIALAGGSILYQTQTIMRRYPAEAHVGAAVQLFASVMLLFWYVLRLLGRDQAERVADRLAHEPITAIYVSTLRRTAQTAAPLAAHLGLEPRVEPDLREVYLGEWEGGTFRKHVAEGHPVARRMSAERRGDVIPGAEPADAFAARVRAAIDRIATAHPDETVAVVSHGGVIGQVLADASGSQGFAFTGSDNGAISHLVIAPDRWVIRRYNDTAHLGLAFTTAPEPLT